MKIVLSSLHLINWKGAIDEKISFDPDFTKILGTNGAGKSRIAEGLNWVLVGKDLNDRKDYDIKDNARPEMNRQDHIVIADLLVDGKSFVLKRVYREKWQKKQGSAQSEFTGNESLFFKNDIQFSATQYKEVVESLASEGTLKLITNPQYFNGLKWDEQRKILIQMAGAISDEDVLARTEEEFGKLDSLKAILNSGTPIAEEKARLSAKKKLLKDELDNIPGRIDEVSKQKPTETAEDFAKYEASIAILDTRDQNIVNEMSQLQNEGAEKMNEFYKKKNEISEIKAEANQIYSNKKREYKAKFDDKDNERTIAQNGINRLKQSIVSDTSLMQAEERKLLVQKQEIEEIKARFSEKKQSEFVFDSTPYDAKNCPVCGNEMKSGTINLDEIKATKEAEFNTKKASDLEAIKKSGIEKSASLQPMIDLINSYKDSIEATKVKIQEATEALEKMESAAMPTDAEILAEVELLQEVIELKSKIANLESILPEEPKPVDNEVKKAERQAIKLEKDRLVGLLSGRENLVKLNTRIKELEARESELGQLIADCENVMFAIENFSKGKMALVEKRVNDMFGDISFKLFSTQVNGAVVEDCELWKDGKPWRSLSNGQKVVAGLDCIRTFNKHFDIYAPILIENNEGVFDIPKMDSQVIGLFASEADKKLRVVHG